MTRSRPSTSRTRATAARGSRRPLQVPSPAATAILARFRVIFRSARQHYEAVERELGIGGAQLRALAIIDAQPGIGISALARRLLVRQPTASSAVDQLVRGRLVRRQRSVADHRAIHLHTTVRARALLRRAPGPLVGVLADALSALDAGAQRRLAVALDSLLDEMKLRDDRARFQPLADL